MLSSTTPTGTTSVETIADLLARSDRPLRSFEFMPPRSDADEDTAMTWLRSALPTLISDAATVQADDIAVVG